MKKLPIYITTLLIILVVFSLSGCAQKKEPETTPTTENQSQDVAAEEVLSSATPSPSASEAYFASETPNAGSLSVTGTPAEENAIATAAPTKDMRLDPEDWRIWPVMPDHISETAIQIYRQGLASGNDPNSFSVTGDCQAIRDVMLGEFDDPRKYHLSPEEQYLQETVDAFQGSFNRNGMAVRGGFTAASVLSPLHADTQHCNPGETPLGCEFRLHNPSILIISLEVWNDRANLDRYEIYLRQIIEYAIDEGVLPILATKADMAEALKHVINPTLVRLSYEYDIPLWNFWLAVQPLPNHGIDPDRDGFHISEEAWKVKSFTALKALDAVWRAVQLEKDVPTATTLPTATPAPSATPMATIAVPTPTPIPICNPPEDCVLLGIMRSMDGKLDGEGVHLLDIETGETAQVVGEGYQLQAASFDGKKMLVNRGQELYISDVDGTDLTLISETFYQDSAQGAYWLDGSKRIVLIDQRSGHRVIWLYDIGSGNWRQLTADQEDPVSLILSSSQERVYWQSGCEDNGECEGNKVWGTSIMDGSSERLESVIQPDFSPDNIYMAFMDPAYTYEHQFGANFKLLIENMEIGLPSRRMVVFPAATGFQVRNQLESYVWSPDSTRLLILLDERSHYYGRSAGYHTFQFILSSGLLLEYDRLIGEAPRGAWAPDSRRAIFAITQTVEGSYAVQLTMLDTTTRSVREYAAFSMLNQQDFMFVDKMFWLPSHNNK